MFFVNFQIRADFERQFGSEVARRLESQKSTLVQQIISMVSRDSNVFVTNGSAEGLQESRFKAVDFANQKDILNNNKIIFNESE